MVVRIGNRRRLGNVRVVLIGRCESRQVVEIDCIIAVFAAGGWRGGGR